MGWQDFLGEGLEVTPRQHHFFSSCKVLLLGGWVKSKLWSHCTATLSASLLVSTLLVPSLTLFHLKDRVYSCLISWILSLVPAGQEIPSQIFCRVESSHLHPLLCQDIPIDELAGPLLMNQCPGFKGTSLWWSCPWLELLHPLFLELLWLANDRLIHSRLYST